MNAWIFDVDGVITNLKQKKIVEPNIISELLKRLQKQDIIAFNTGRSITFIKEQILKPLENNLKDKVLLNNIYVIGEMGGTWLKYTKGKVEQEIDKSIFIPEVLQQKIRKLIESKYSNTMFFDSEKKTMITIECIKGTNQDKFHHEQDRLIENVKGILNNEGLQLLKIIPNDIATDIQNPKVGKALGVQRLLDLLDNRTVDEFETFGDNLSDLEMYDHLVKTGHKAKFIYVGTTEINRNDANIIKTKNKFDKGTLEYLNSHSSE